MPPWDWEGVSVIVGVLSSIFPRICANDYKDKDGVTNMTTDPSSPVTGQAGCRGRCAELQGTSRSPSVVLGARAGGNHTQPDPAWRLCTGLTCCSVRADSASICCEPRAAPTWAESLEPPGTTV